MFALLILWIGFRPDLGPGRVTVSSAGGKSARDPSGGQLRFGMTEDDKRLGPPAEENLRNGGA
jgi:hypothetical protein